MALDVLLGLQWGDEGKGKIVDFLAPNYQVVCRYQGGPNAGHTLYHNGQKLVLHTIPSGVLHEDIINVIGNGVVINPVTLLDEMKRLESMGVDLTNRLVISDRAHLILPTHRWLDAASEASKGTDRIGSTLRGIGPTYMDKTGRNGLRVGDISTDSWLEKVQKLIAKHRRLLKVHSAEVDFDLDKEMDAWYQAVEVLKGYPIVNSIYYLHEQLYAGKRILAEGAQGTMLDIDFGTYPYVTSSNTTTAGVCTGLGVAPSSIERVYGISKAYCTRVGSGPFPTELHDDVGAAIAKAGHEFGATTGRPRRCGWLDLVQLRYACMINGVTDLIMTKADVLEGFDEIAVAHRYGTDERHAEILPFDLSEAAAPAYISFSGWSQTKMTPLDPSLSDYITYIQSYINTPITYLSNGPERDAILKLS